MEEKGLKIVNPSVVMLCERMKVREDLALNRDAMEHHLRGDVAAGEEEAELLMQAPQGSQDVGKRHVRDTRY